MNRNECSCDDNMTKRDSLVLLMRNLDPRAKESAIIRYLLIKAPALWSEKHKPPTKHPVPPRSPLKLLIAGNGKKVSHKSRMLPQNKFIFALDSR